MDLIIVGYFMAGECTVNKLRPIERLSTEQ